MQNATAEVNDKASSEVTKQAEVAAIQTITAQGERRGIPHSALFLSPFNVRKSEFDQPNEQAALKELSAQIFGVGGVIENLVVYAEIKRKKPTGRYGVAGGGRRFRATAMLIDAGKFEADHLMPCLIVPEETAIEMSLMENSGREPMHPVDEFEAFKALIDGGREIGDIAAIFGLPQIVVSRRMRLADVALRFLAMYRTGEINQLSVLEALAVTTDHAAQVRAWDALNSYQKTNPSFIRKMIMSEQVDITEHPLGRFVGAETYEEAGGHVERDLFSDEGRGYISDFDLLTRLANDRLETIAQPYRDSGDWAWVEIVQRLDFDTKIKFPDARTNFRAPTADEAAAIAPLQERIDELQQRIVDMEDGDEENYDEELYGELENQIGELDEQLESIRDNMLQIIPEHRPLAGVLIGINEYGELLVVTGKLKPEDAKQLKGDALPSGQGNTAIETEKPIHSEALTRQLTAQRTAAMQLALARETDVALNLLATQLFMQASERYATNADTLQISLKQPNLKATGEITAIFAACLDVQEKQFGW